MTMVIGISGQVSGINAILFYAKFIMLDITGDETKARYSCFALGLAQIFVTLLSSLYLDRFGKRTFMLVGQSIILATLLSLFLTYIINPDA
jgi:major inositol transporter-like SP family MFS transporter